MVNVDHLIWADVVDYLIVIEMDPYQLSESPTSVAHNSKRNCAGNADGSSDVCVTSHSKSTQQSLEDSVHSPASVTASVTDNLAERIARATWLDPAICIWGVT